MTSSTVALLYNIIQRNDSKKQISDIMSIAPKLKHLQIPLDRIKLATNNFADQNILGRGGFGKVYKGELPMSTTSGEPFNTIIVAVKRLDLKSRRQSGQGRQQFFREIFILANHKHANMVTLVGFCEEGDEHIIVYEHEAHGSLDKFLGNTELTWLQRVRICLGAARGLVYLHGSDASVHRVIHCDIKSANILLDENWEAKISDFGLSKIGLMHQEFTYLFTNACGTKGYVDPQYAANNVLTKESDVYSFGMVLFEVLCGRCATVVNVIDKKHNYDYLSESVKLHYEKGTLDEIIFSSLREEIKPSSLETFSRIAYRCLNTDNENRPTMRAIVQELETALELQMNIRKTELWGSSTGGEPWSFRLESNKKLRKIFIDHKRWIYSIAFTTQDVGDSVNYFQQYGAACGPSGDTITQVNFDIDEEIIEIQGTITKVPIISGSLTLLSSLCFLTNKKRYGPFGYEEEDARFSKSWDEGSFRGFYGRAGFYLDGLGCFLKSIP
ncbi:hypothetical protein OSB04_026536 [Centaurea solstitialis]|uniref:Jacalin-like lectin domain-containing protein n=1 Tax=Centaurea solstitialis TaxID=347529 RepID=A0AA38SC23_9ASTR|nr:hypothetical protein OSB04_026536 [Centaurea solstitialis]